MMEPFERIDIQELPLSVLSFRRKVEDFLGSNGLRLEEVDLYLAVLDGDGGILAGGGLQRDIIKCIAVSDSARSLGLSVPLISRLISVAAERGYANVKVFTKPENRRVFESLGFHVLAEAPQAILMENGRGLEEYCGYLRGFHAVGVIIMNANPFTLGHRYLVERAASVISGDSPRRRPRKLIIIPVKEDRSRFPYIARMEMIRQGTKGLATVVEGSDYQISAATFPTYFLKNLSDAAETQMRLDIDLFGRHIAPALGATKRFVGSEPTDRLTARYNALMKELLPAYGVEVVEVPRLTDEDGAISASWVRASLAAGDFASASALIPESSRPNLMTYLAVRALQKELEAPFKPGLVGPDSNGAHQDMDYALMLRSIDAIRPFFPRMATAGSPEDLRQLGIEAERAMMAATSGVNTHRGAIFALGLALNASGDSARMAGLAAQICGGNDTPGARRMALGGYKDLFDTWLPFYLSVKDDTYGLQKTLLKIMSGLDDTCVIHRVGPVRAQEVKAEAGALLEAFSVAELKEMCGRYAAEGVSPGGAADMLALTIFMESILH